MRDHSKTVVTFLLGVGAGIAIGLFLTSENKEELISDLEGTAKNVKGSLDEEIEKGKKFVDDLKSQVNDLLENS